MNPHHTDPQRIRRQLDSFGGMPVLVLGDVMLDVYMSGEVERISPEGPVPVVNVQGRERRLGGAANVAWNLAALGAEPLLVSVIGEDEAAVELLDCLADKGISSDGILRDASRPTTVKTRILGAGQQICRFDRESRASLNKATRERLGTLALKQLERAKALILSDYGKGVMDDETVADLVREARRRKIPVVVDPKEGHFSAYQGADLVTPNKAEAGGSFGLPIRSRADLETVGRGLLERLDLGALMITLGEEGIALFEAGRDLRIFPARGRRVYDVTGAGDTVVSVLALALGAGLGLDEGAVLANLAAALVVAEVGTAVATAETLIAAAMDEVLEEGGPGQVHAPGRVLDRDEAAVWAAELRREGQRLVFTNGCFDLLHFGHLALLREGARQGDRLVVGLNSDASVRRLKGPERPVHGEAERARLLAHLSPVSAVVIFEEDTPLELIREMRPEVLVKGDEYNDAEIVGAEEVKGWGGRVHRFPMQEGYSTTRALEKSRRSAGEAPEQGA